MNDDIISREQAIAEMHLAFGSKSAVHSQVVNILNNLPSAQRKGKWIRIIDEVFADRFECSECGKLPPIENFEWWLSDYCPNCGAKMVNEDELS